MVSIIKITVLLSVLYFYRLVVLINRRLYESLGYRNYQFDLTLQSPRLLSKVVLSDVSGSETLSECFDYQITAVTDEHNSDYTQLVGHPVKVSIAAYGQSRFIQGFVRCVRRKVLVATPNIITYQMSVVPWLWFWSLDKQYRVFHQVSVIGVIKKLCADYGYVDVDYSLLTADYPEMQVYIQYNETTLEFVTRLLLEYNMFYFFSHNADRHCWHLADSTAAYYTPDQQPQLTGVSSVYTMSNQSESHSDDSFIAITQIKQKNNHKGSMVGYDCYHSLRFETSEVALMPGHIIQKPAVEGGEHQDPVVVVKTEMTLKNSVVGEGAMSTVSSRYGLPKQQGYAINADQYYYPKVSKPHQINTIHVAVVVGSDENGLAEEYYGKVKIKYLCDQSIQVDYTCWAYCSEWMNGNGWGSHCKPRVNQEVLVGFIDGAIDKPIILGALYNKTNTLPFLNYSQVGFKTASRGVNQNGIQVTYTHELCFDESEYGPSIRWATDKAMVFKIEGDRVTRVAEDNAFFCKHTMNIDVTHGACSLTAGGQLLLKADQNNYILLEDHQITMKGTTISLNAVH